MFRNMVTSLLKHDRIKTTEAKAKSIKPIAEKLVTLARRGDLSARRQAARELHDPAVLQKYQGEDVTALVIAQPNFFGVLEDVDALAAWAKAGCEITMVLFRAPRESNGSLRLMY